MDQVDLELRLKTEKADAKMADTARKGRDLFEKKGFKINIKGGELPLGRITGDFEKFQGSLDAATARVLAFTATTTVIYGLSTAFTRLFTDSVKLEKQLAGIQSILQTSNSNLQQFSKELFTLANSTGQSFDVAANAASEFARQGLSLAETLKATNAALVFSKIAGVDAAQAVENLTASINTFGEEALSYTDVVDTIVSLDNAFAISAGGIADGLKRVGSVASESGIQLKEIASLISVVQQVSARGAPVISNGLKTIFTRLGRQKVQESLNGIGVATQGANGEFRSQIDILTDLSTRLDTLSDSQRAFILEQVAGVYQINTLQATLKSLSGEYSLYDKAVKVASDSSGNAAERLKILTDTTDANLQRLKNNVTQFLAETGKATVKPLLDNFLGIGNKILETLNLGSASKEGEDKGFSIGSSILNGISAALSGPGTILIIATVARLLGKITKDALSALETLSGLKNASLVDSQTQKSINDAIAQGNKVLVDRLSITTSIVEKTDILNKLLSAQANKQGIAQVNQAVTTGLAANKKTGSSRGKSKGFIPSYFGGFIPKNIERQEQMGARSGGYVPGDVVPSPVGGVMNTAESVVYASSKYEPFINPPENSIAGINHKRKSIESTGINPYGIEKGLTSRGFIPNFAYKVTKQNLGKNSIISISGKVSGKQSSLVADSNKDNVVNLKYKVRQVENTYKDNFKNSVLEYQKSGYNDSNWQAIESQLKGSNYTKEQIKTFKENLDSKGTTGKSLITGKNVSLNRQITGIQSKLKGAFFENLVGNSLAKAISRNKVKVPESQNSRMDLLNSQGNSLGEIKSGNFSYDNLASKAIASLSKETKKKYLDNGEEDNIKFEKPYSLFVPTPTSSRGFIPNFASKYTQARQQKRDELRASLFNIGDFAGGAIKNVNAQTEFNKARDKNPNVEWDDKINQVGFKVERIPIPDREFEAALRSKENNKEVTTKFENYVIDYLNKKGYSFKPGRNTLYGKENAAVDGYNIKQNFIELLEVKGGGWDAPDVNNKFGRFTPENLVDLGPQLVSKFFKEGDPDPNINDKIRIRNVLAIPNLTGGVFKKNIAPQYPSADVEKIEKARQRTRPSGKKIPAKFAWMKGVIDQAAMTNSSGFIPNFASVESSPYAKSVMGLEKEMSGKKPVLGYEPGFGNFIYNTGQNGFKDAVAQHGGLKNAMRDSVAGQQSAGLASRGFIPNFAAPNVSPLMSRIQQTAANARTNIGNLGTRARAGANSPIGLRIRSMLNSKTSENILAGYISNIDGNPGTSQEEIEAFKNALKKVQYDTKEGLTLVQRSNLPALKIALAAVEAGLKTAKGYFPTRGGLGSDTNSFAEGFIPNFATARNKRDEKRRLKIKKAQEAQEKKVRIKEEKTQAAQQKVAAVRARPALPTPPSRLRSGLGGSFQVKREIFERRQAERKAAQATAQPIQRSILTTAQLRKNSPQEQARRNAKADFIRSGREMAKLPQVPGRYQPTMTGQMQSVSRKDIFKNLTQDRANKRRVGAKGVENTWKGGQSQSKLFENRNGEIVGSEERNRKADSIRAGRIEKRLSAAGIKTPGGMYGSPTLPTKGIQGRGRGIEGYGRTQIENRFQAERDARNQKAQQLKEQLKEKRERARTPLPTPPNQMPGGRSRSTGNLGMGDGRDGSGGKMAGKAGSFAGRGALIASMALPMLTGAFTNPDEAQRSTKEKLAVGAADAAGIGIMTTSMLAMVGVTGPLGVGIGVAVGAFKLLNTAIKATIPSTKEQSKANQALISSNEQSVSALNTAIKSSGELEQLKASGDDPKRIAKKQLEFNKALTQIKNKDVVNALTTEKDPKKREQIIADFQEEKNQERTFSESMLAASVAANQVAQNAPGVGASLMSGIFGDGKGETNSGGQRVGAAFEVKDWDNFLTPLVNQLDFTKDASGEAAIAMKRLASGQSTDVLGFVKRFGKELGMTSEQVQIATQTITQQQGAYDPESLAKFARYTGEVFKLNADIAQGVSAQKPLVDVNLQKVFESAVKDLTLDTSLTSYKDASKKGANLDIEKNKLSIDQEMGLMTPMEAVRRSSEMQGKESNLAFEQKGNELLATSVQNLLSLVPANLDVETQANIVEASKKTLTEGGDITELESLIKNSLGAAQDSKDILEKIANFSQETAQAFTKLKVDQSSSERVRTVKEQQAIEKIQTQGDINLGKRVISGQKADPKNQLLDPVKVAKLEDEIRVLRDQAKNAGLGTDRGRALTKKAEAKAIEVQKMRESSATAEEQTMGVAYTKTAQGEKDIGTAARKEKENERILQLVGQFNKESGGAFKDSFSSIKEALYSGNEEQAKKLIDEGLSRGGEKTLATKAIAKEIRSTGGEAGLFGKATPTEQGPTKFESALAKMNEQAMAARVNSGRVLEKGKAFSKDTAVQDAKKAQEESIKANQDYQVFRSGRLEKIKENALITDSKEFRTKIDNAKESVKLTEGEQALKDQGRSTPIAQTKDRLSSILGKVQSGDFTPQDLKDLQSAAQGSGDIIPEIKALNTERQKIVEQGGDTSMIDRKITRAQVESGASDPKTMAMIQKTLATVESFGLNFDVNDPAGNANKEAQLSQAATAAAEKSLKANEKAAQATKEFEDYARDPNKRGVDFLTNDAKRENAKIKFRESNDPALKSLADKMDTSASIKKQMADIDKKPEERRRDAADTLREALSNKNIKIGKEAEAGLQQFQQGKMPISSLQAIFDRQGTTSEALQTAGVGKSVTDILAGGGTGKEQDARIESFKGLTFEDKAQKEKLQKDLDKNETDLVTEGAAKASSVNTALYSKGQIAPGIIDGISKPKDRAQVEAYNAKVREREAKESELKGLDKNLQDTKAKESERKALSKKVKDKNLQDFESGKITADELAQKNKALGKFERGEVGINDGSLMSVRKDLIDQAGDPQKVKQLEQESASLYREASALGGTSTEAGRKKMEEAKAKQAEMVKIRESGEGKYEALNTGEGTQGVEKRKTAIKEEIEKNKAQESEMLKGLEGILGAMTGVSNALQATVEANRVRDEAAAAEAAAAKETQDQGPYPPPQEYVANININVTADNPLTPAQLAQAKQGSKEVAADFGRAVATGAGQRPPIVGPTKSN
jgi:TP901 family phage tail tape measure protein